MKAVQTNISFPLERSASAVNKQKVFNFQLIVWKFGLPRVPLLLSAPLTKSKPGHFVCPSATMILNFIDYFTTEFLWYPSNVIRNLHDSSHFCDVRIAFTSSTWISQASILRPQWNGLILHQRWRTWSQQILRLYQSLHSGYESRRRGKLGTDTVNNEMNIFHNRPRCE